MRINRTRSLLAAAAMAFTLLLRVDAGLSAEDTTPAPKLFKEEELASLLAPIALYPDTVVAQILMASTYPLEVVEASRWVEKNPNLKGEALATEAKKQSWDQSVQALTALPDVLKQMDTKLDWTQKLGDAFLAQQIDVMAMVQTLRGKAQAAGNLKSDEHLTVKVEPAAAPAAAATTTTASATTQTIIIESADPQVIYVPTYSPTYAYGPWYYPSYPPYYFPYPPAYVPGAALWWGASVAIRVGFWSGAWNNNCNWGGGTINVNNVNIGNGNRGNGNWNHNPEHRKGVSYRDNSTAKKYDRGSAGNASSRDAYRGRSNTGASAGTRDLGGGGGASAGTRDLGGGGGASAGTRDLGGGGGSSARASNSSSSKYGGSGNRSSSGSSRSSSSALGGMSSGSRASSYSSRGSMSRGGGGGRRR